MFFSSFFGICLELLKLNVSVLLPASSRSHPTPGAVVSESTLCSNVGAAILRQGGNAADAMVGSSFCVGVVAPYHCGIGGGGFALVRSPDGTFEAIDYREAAPAAAYEDMFQGNANGSILGGLASGVPGELRGLEYLHRRYGRLPWSQVVMPAVRIAREGFNVTKDLAGYMEIGNQRWGDFLTVDPAWAEDFASRGKQISRGELFTRKRYADTLEAVALHGPDVFYGGPIAEATINAIRRRNGTMTLADLASYRVVIRGVVSIMYRGFEIFGVGAPASGAVVLSALKTVEGYPSMGDPAHLNISTHRLDEATRFAYAERSSLGDPTFWPSAIAHQREMLDASYAATKQAKISDKHTLNVSDYNPEGFEIRSDHGTSHLSAADASGLAVALTSTINFIWGNLIMVPETGVALNNEMNDFSIPRAHGDFGFRPSPSNYVRPGKRPQSSMTPIIVEHARNRSLYHITGAAGGARIITAVLQDLWHGLDYGLSAYAAVREARFHDMLLPNRIQFEWSLNRTSEDKRWAHTSEESVIGTGEVRGFDNRTVSDMRTRGHNVAWVPAGWSETHTIRRMSNGSFEVAGDPRQSCSGGVVVEAPGNSQVG